MKTILGRSAEIARAQIWQWTRHPAGCLDDGRNIDLALFDRILDQELAEIRADAQQIPGDQLQKAADLLRQLIHDDSFIDFLTLPAYQLLP